MRSANKNEEWAGFVQEFIKHFRRESADVWSCVEPAELTLPSGRIQVTPGSRFVRGTRFMGVDLAEMLEHTYQQAARR